MKINAINSVGRYVSAIPAKAKGYFKSDSFANSFASLKGKVDKNTVIGLGVVAGASILAIKSIKSIKNELEKIGNKK